MTEFNKETVDELASRVLDRIIEKTGDKDFNIRVTPAHAVNLNGVDFNIIYRGAVVQVFYIDPSEVPPVWYRVQ